MNIEQDDIQNFDNDPVYKNRLYMSLFVSVVYSTLMLFIPWEVLQGYAFVDRLENVTYFLYEKNVLEYREFTGVIDYLKHEALWHYLMDQIIHHVGVPIEYVFNAIAFLCISTFSFFLANRKGYLSVLLLTNPLLVTLAFSQSRIALAFSLLLLAYMSRRLSVVILTVLFCGFIHTASFLFFGICISIYVIKKRLIDKSANKSLIFFILCFIGLFISIVLGQALDIILGLLGDRRAVVYTGNAQSGIKYTLFWVVILGFCSVQEKSFYNNVINCFSVIILSLVTFSLITGGYSSRFLALSLPMIFITMLNFKPSLKLLSLILYIIYGSLQWVYWFKMAVI